MSCPASRRSSTTRRPMAPVAPKTVTFTRRLPLWLLWWWRGGRRGRCHRRAGRWTPRFISYDTDRSATTGGGPAWRTSRSRSGYPYGALALGVLGCERMERIGSLLELVGLLDGDPERPGLKQSREPLQVLLGRHRPYVVALRSFAGRRERRGPAPVVVEDLRVGVEAFWGVGDKVQEGLDALWVALVHERGDVGLARKDLADAQVFQVFLVFGQSRSDNPRAGVGCELDGEAADASVRSYDQDCVALGDAKCVYGSKGGDRGQRGGAGAGGVNAVGLASRDGLRDGYKLGPTSVVHRRAHPRDEAEHLVAFREAAHLGAHLLYDSGEVAPEHDRELVLDHVLEHPGRDGVVYGVHRGGANAHEHLVVGRRRGREVLAQARGRVEVLQDDGSHGLCLLLIGLLTLHDVLLLHGFRVIDRFCGRS